MTETRDGAIYRTEPIGFCRADRPIRAGELYCSISAKPGQILTLRPFLE